MSTETPPPEPEEPQPRDEQWDKLRDFVKAAMDVGITDVSELTELVNATRNEDLRATINTTIEQLAKPLKEWQAIMKQFSDLVNARELIAEKQAQTEVALLDKIHELSKEAQTPEDLYTLAAAYTQLRHLSVAPGFYTPDVRHTGPDESSAEEDEGKS